EPSRAGDVVEEPRLRLRLRYPGGTRDAETLLVDPARRRMFVVSKGLLTGTVPLVLVNDGAVAADGTVLLRTYGDLAAFDPFPLDGGTRLLTPRATAS